MEDKFASKLLLSLNAKLVASHLILLKEIRSIQGSHFDSDLETARLQELKNNLLDKSGREALTVVLKRRAEARKDPEER